MTQRDDALAKARAAKARFEDSLSLARHNMTPVKLGKRAAAKTKRGVTGAVQAQPVATAAIGLGLLAFLFRKPLAGLVRRIRKEQRHD
jgi:hypothetical protein